MTFKLILTGVTGQIGSEVLQQSLNNPSITSIIVLTRRPLPELVSNSKLEVLVLKDFQQYPAEIRAKLSGADGCVWCMTTPVGDPVLELEYPKAFAQAFSSTLAEHDKQFRYLHVTGAAVERDQAKSLWVKSQLRKVKGQGELQMIQVAKEAATNGLWETIIARPGGVVKRGTVFGDAASLIGGSTGWVIRSDELALALINAVMNGSEDQLLQPQALVRQGQELIRKQRENRAAAH